MSVASDDSLIYLIGGYGHGEGRRPSAPRAMLVFTALALGMALPYALLCFAPALVRRRHWWPPFTRA